MTTVVASHTGSLTPASNPWQFQGQITWASDIDPVVLPANQPVVLRLALAWGGLDTSSMSISFGSTGTGRAADLPAAGPFTSGTDYTVASHKDRTVTYTVTGVGPASPGAFAMRARSEDHRLDLYTGTPVSWTAPAGCRLDIGGAGGEYVSHSGGKGGRLTGMMSAGPVEIRIGAPGSGSVGGWNGGGDSGTVAPPGVRSGGGGGATDLRRGGSALGDRFAVAGGGGGGGAGGATLGVGGDGGGPIGGNGQKGGGPFAVDRARQPRSTVVAVAVAERVPLVLLQAEQRTPEVPEVTALPVRPQARSWSTQAAVVLHRGAPVPLALVVQEVAVLAVSLEALATVPVRRGLRTQAAVVVLR